MATVRPKWSEIAAIIGEGVGHFKGKPKEAEWSPAEQLAVVLAPEVFGLRIRKRLATAKDRLPEVEIMLAQDSDWEVLTIFAKEVSTVGGEPTAERLLIERGTPLARILATSKHLSEGAQNAIVQTLSPSRHNFDKLSRRRMLNSQEFLSPYVMHLLVNQLVYEPNDRGLGTWDPVVARLFVEHIRADCRWDEHMAEQADRIEESLKQYTIDTGDTSWEDEDFEDMYPEELPSIKVRRAQVMRKR